MARTLRLNDTLPPNTRLVYAGMPIHGNRLSASTRSRYLRKYWIRYDPARECYVLTLPGAMLTGEPRTNRPWFARLVNFLYRVVPV